MAWFLAANAIIAAGVVTVNGTENLLLSVRVLMEMGAGVPALANKSLGSLAYWVYYGHPTTYPKARTLINLPQPHLLVFASKVLSLGFYVACLAQVWLVRRADVTLSTRQKALILAAFALILSLASPVSWRHGYSAGLLLFILLWVNALRAHKVKAVYAILLAWATISVGSLVFDLGAQAPLPGMVKILLASFWPLSCASLCLYVLYQSGRADVDATPVGFTGLAPAHD